MQCSPYLLPNVRIIDESASGLKSSKTTSSLHISSQGSKKNKHGTQACHDPSRPQTTNVIANQDTSNTKASSWQSVVPLPKQKRHESTLEITHPNVEADGQRTRGRKVDHLGARHPPYSRSSNLAETYMGHITRACLGAFIGLAFSPWPISSLAVGSEFQHSWRPLESYVSVECFG